MAQRKQVKGSAEAEGPGARLLAQVRERVAKATDEATSELAPLEEALGQAEKAHAEAVRQVTVAYKDNELKAAKTYSELAQGIKATYDGAVAQALKERTGSIQRAKATLVQAEGQADDVCSEAMSAALLARDVALGEAWRDCADTTEQIWQLYNKIVNKGGV